jgi:hypothetical protein
MALSITEKILGNNNIQTNIYLASAIQLTKSIVVVNSKEASLYNKYISIAYPSHSIDLGNPSTWRYYKHLNAEYHVLDTPMTINSLDNNDLIVISKTTLDIHRKTKEELLKYGNLYSQIVSKYPEQELLLRSILNYTPYTNINNIIRLKDFSIVSYNDSLIEENEDNLIPELEIAIENYANIRLIQQYGLSDSLFSAAQYAILYKFILLKILAIRLANAKTIRAHSYHIRNYLASHLNLDVYYDYLTKKQIMFLYRNLLYLNNHSGNSQVFDILIDKLFTERHISIVNYQYKQINSLDTNNNVEYRFDQRLLNRDNLVYSINDYTLETMREKEFYLVPGNQKELTYHLNEIDDKFKYSLSSVLLTKDLETIIIDNTDNVRYKLIPTIIDYWAYLLKTNRMNFIVKLINPIKNSEVTLNTRDLFKLFVVVLYKLNEAELTSFPVYYINRVFKEPLPSTDYLLSLCYRKYYWYRSLIDDIKFNVPGYSTIVTSFAAQQYFERVYKYNMALWLLLSNLDDRDTNGQFELMIDRMHKFERYNFDSETVSAFLNRTGFNDLFSYNRDTLEALMYSILNNMYDNKLDFLNMYKYIQKAIVDIFNKFKSYTTQIINNYYSSNAILAGHKDPRATVTEDRHSLIYYYDAYILNVDMDYRTRNSVSIDFKDDSTHGCRYREIVNVDLGHNINSEVKSIGRVNVYFNTKLVNDLGNSNWIVNQSSDDQLEFLALNQ